jgi:membrane protein
VSVASKSPRREHTSDDDARNTGPLSLLSDSWDRFASHGDLVSAATSFFALVSIAPLFIVAIGLAGLVFERGQARAGLLRGLRRFASSDVVALVQRLLESAEQQESKVATVVAVAFLFWGAIRFFVQIQDSLNLIWGVRPPSDETFRESLRRVAIKRLLSLGMVIGCGLLLLSTLILQALSSAAGTVLEELGAAMEIPPLILAVQQVGVSIALMTAVFAMVYRMLPDTDVRWRDVWIGALLTATLTLLGTWVLGKVFGMIAPAWLQGALGSVAAFVLWTYYSALVFFFGAAFTRTLSLRTRGDDLSDDSDSVPDE